MGNPESGGGTAPETGAGRPRRPAKKGIAAIFLYTFAGLYVVALLLFCSILVAYILRAVVRELGDAAWLLAVVPAFVILVGISFAWWWWPQRGLRRELQGYQREGKLLGDRGRDDESLELPEYLEAVNAQRATLATSIGGAVLILSLFFTWYQLAQGQRAYELARRSQATEGFAQSLELLQGDSPSIRRGAMYTLEQLARNNSDYYWPVMRVLADYVRVHASSADEPCRDERASEADWHFRPDVVTAVSIIARRPAPVVDPDIRLDLRCTNLELLESLEDANFENVVLINSSLRNLRLSRANLRNAELDAADLRDADLRDADVEGADLGNALFDSGTCLVGANTDQAATLPVDFNQNDRLARCDGGTGV